MKKVHYREVPPDPVGEEGASGLTVRWVISEKDGAPNFSMRVFEVDLSETKFADSPIRKGMTKSVELFVGKRHVITGAKFRMEGGW